RRSLADSLGNHFCGSGRKGPAQVPVTRVVIDAWITARPDDRHHIRHHRPATRPRLDVRSFDIRKVSAQPSDQRGDPVQADIVVHSGELGGACDTKAVGSKPTRYDLRCFVEKANPRRRRSASIRTKSDGHGGLLYGIDV